MPLPLRKESFRLSFPKCRICTNVVGPSVVKPRPRGWRGVAPLCPWASTLRCRPRRRPPGASEMLSVGGGRPGHCWALQDHPHGDDGVDVADVPGARVHQPFQVSCRRCEWPDGLHVSESVCSGCENSAPRAGATWGHGLPQSGAWKSEVRCSRLGLWRDPPPGLWTPPPLCVLTGWGHSEIWSHCLLMKAPIP